MKTNTTPGALVNEVLGTTVIAESLGLARSTVWRWGKDKPIGTGGIVPAQYHRPVLSLAHRLGVRLSTDDLVHGRMS